jgi:zinc transport system substrate-binding protein
MQKGIVTIAILAVMLVGCQSKQKKGQSAQKPMVTVSIIPQKYFVEQIAGDFYDVNVLVPPGASPDSYEPTPKQITMLANSESYIYIGHLGFEKSWLKKIVAAAPGLSLVSSSMGIDLLRGDCEHEQEGESHLAEGTDPHIWNSPENVKKICGTMCGEFVRNHPEKQKDFEANMAVFFEKIDSLDIHLRNELNDCQNHAFMIYHPALAYFARDYHLNQYSIEYEGKEPSPAYMKRMVDLAREKKINTIFIQAQFETAKAEVIAKEIGAKVVVVDPLAPDWMKEMTELGGKLKASLSD